MRYHFVGNLIQREKCAELNFQQNDTSLMRIGQNINKICVFLRISDLEIFITGSKQVVHYSNDPYYLTLTLTLTLTLENRLERKICRIKFPTK